jgi:hypothetical protein
MYIDEEGSPACRQAVVDARLVATSVVAYVEARAALARKRRERALSPAAHRGVVRNLDQDSGAITRVDFATLGASVLQIDENLKRFADNRIGLATEHVDDKANSATVVFKLRIVQTLFFRDTGIHVLPSFLRIGLEIGPSFFGIITLNVCTK